MNKFDIKIKKLQENAIIPSYGSPFAAGADLYALCDDEVEIAPHETVLIHTGISMEIPEGFGGFIFARSGLASKRNLAPANKVGVVDSDYRGEVMVALHNHGNEVQKNRKRRENCTDVHYAICGGKLYRKRNPF